MDYRYSNVVVIFFLLDRFFHFGRAQDWSVDDFALFDLVEELDNKNFYSDILQIKQDAPVAQIKRAYRKMSLIYHPDKNKDPDAAEKFRQLAAVYEVLKDETSRKKYDDVLEFGLPNWKQPIFYYRTVRKMPWWETALLLLIIITTGQYLMLWGSYAEQMLTVQEDIDRLRKKEKKYKKQNIDVNDLIDDLKEKRVEKPSIKQLLPFSLFRVRGTSLNYVTQFEKCEVISGWSTRRSKTILEVEENDEDEKVWKRQIPTFEEPLHFDLATDLKPVSTSASVCLSDTDGSIKEKELEVEKCVEWTVEETAHLIRLTTNKYPTGTPNRWEKIALVLKRKPEDITNMVGKLKHMDQQEYQKLSGLANSFQWSSGKTEESDNQHKLDSKLSNVSEQWTQSQQKLLENALQQFPKGTSERWEKISGCVPGKSKDECLLRFKFLAEMVRNRKQVK